MTSHELRLEPQVTEVPRLVDWVAGCCAVEGVAEEVRIKMMLSLEEAVTNVIGNAFEGVPPPHVVLVRLDITEASFTAEIIDNGRSFDPTGVPDPVLSLPLDERKPGGLGIYLMRTMMDRVDYRRSDGRNILRLEKARG